MMYLAFGVIMVVIIHCLIKRNGKSESETKADSPEAPSIDELCSPEIAEAKEPRKRGGLLPILYICLIICLCGIGFIYSSYKSVKESEKITSQGNKATAYITDVQEYEVYDGDGGYTDVRDVYIEYEINGEMYKNVVKKAYMSVMESDIGEPVDIYYDSNDPLLITVPENVENKVSVDMPLGVVIAAIPIAALAAVLIHSFVKRCRDNF